MIEDGRKLQMRQSVKGLVDVYISKESDMKYAETTTSHKRFRGTVGLRLTSGVR
jgi:hypothetical protein